MKACSDCGVRAPVIESGPNKGGIGRHLAPCGAVCAWACSVPDAYDGDRAELHHAPMRLSAHEVLEEGDCRRGCYPPNPARAKRIEDGLKYFRDWIDGTPQPFAVLTETQPTRRFETREQAEAFAAALPAGQHVQIVGPQ